MSGTTELNYWPSPMGTLAWSEDCELAIPVNETVQLLIPNLEPHGYTDGNSRQSSASPWQIVTLATSLWTSTELPMKHPAPFSNYSAGEEISSSVVTSNQWSPPGIARYRKSALAVLTSNLVLSLWASESNPKSADSWGRRLIINDCIESYLEVLDRDEKYDREEYRLEKRRLRTRVRSYSWCSSYRNQDSSSNIGSRLCLGPYVLAVANDDNQVLFVFIESPYTSISSKQGWQATVVAHFSLDASNPVLPSSSLFEDILQQQRIISHLAWSPWSDLGDGQLASVLSYASNNEIHGRNIIMTTHHDSQARQEIFAANNETKYLDIALRYGGPLTWCPKVCDWGRIFLVAFSKLEVFCFTITISDASDFTISSAPLDGNWDSISGVTFKFQSLKEVHMYYSYYMTTARASSVGLKLPIVEGSELPSPSWQAQILESQALFSAANDLAGNAYVKVWGLALSPLGDLFATLSTRHPGDMMEYLVVSEQQCFLSISNPGGSHGNFKIASSDILGDISSEAVFFSVKRWFGYNSETPIAASAAIAQILDQLMKSFGSVADQELRIPAPANTQIDTNESDLYSKPHAIIESLKRDVYFNQKTIKDRQEILVTRICAPQKSTEIQHLKLSRILADAVLKLPNNLHNNYAMSRKIWKTFVLVRNKLHEIGGGSLPVSQVPEDDHAETCSICESPIKMESLDWARCGEEHHFTRCGLSFLAIQGPGISKFCGVCRTQYLKDEYIDREDQSAQTDTVPSGGGGGDEDMADAPEARSPSESGDSNQLSLARILFKACDVCVYCGGKFVG